MSILLYGYTTWTLTKRAEKKTWRQLHKNAASNFEQVMEATPTKHQLYGLLPPITKLSKLDGPDMQDIAGEAGTSS